MVEKDMQTMFKHYLANNPPAKSTVFELKLEKSKRLAFDRVYDHQVAGLRQAKHKGLYHKISDQSASMVNGQRMHFGSKKPFDCLFLKELEAYVVVMFWEPNKLKIAYAIDIDRWVKEKESSEWRSLNEERAQKICSYKVALV